jgi:DNA (cytosine-5)-methyltransferase 1
LTCFAGPGGLGEGFLSLKENGTSQFEGALSIEHDNSSHATLTLRHFVRAFDEMPENYYRYLENAITLDDLYRGTRMSTNARRRAPSRSHLARTRRVK